MSRIYFSRGRKKFRNAEKNYDGGIITPEECKKMFNPPPPTEQTREGAERERNTLFAFIFCSDADYAHFW